MEVVSRREALQLLRSTPVGRVVVTIGALPAALPVNFVVVDDDVWFLTGAGTKLRAAIENAVVAFEADGFEGLGHTGWSVLVQGHATEVTDPAQVENARRAGLGAWLPSSPASLVRVASEIVAGRRISLASAADYRRTPIACQEGSPS